MLVTAVPSPSSSLSPYTSTTRGETTLTSRILSLALGVLVDLLSQGNMAIHVDLTEPFMVAFDERAVDWHLQAERREEDAR